MFIEPSHLVDTWTPDLSKKQEPKSSSTEDLDVQVDKDNLTPDQLSKAKSVLVRYIFEGPY